MRPPAGTAWVRAVVRPTAEVPLDGPGVERLLDADQQARRSRLVRPGDRDDFLAARVLAQDLLGSPDLVVHQRCATCGGPHGRPEVVDRPDLHLSWAHADGLVAAALSSAAVGVDVERVRSDEHPPLVTRAVQDPPVADPVRDWLGWTRTEALVKRGDADLDDALGWTLTGPPAPDGVEVPRLLPGHGTGVLTDLVGPGGAWVATVAGHVVATWS